MACGFAFADVAPADANPPAEAAVAKPKPAFASKAHVKKAAPGKDLTKASKNAPDSKNASTRAGSGRMQVEEPKSAVPMSTAKESRSWQKNHARGLTEAQKQAFRERKEKMEGMIAVIKEKRKALRDAKPEERAVIARELHSLILEKDPDAAKGGASVASTAASTAASAAASTAASRADANANANSNVNANANGSDHPARPSAQADAAKKAEAAELRRQRIERYQSQKKDEMRRLQFEKQRSELDDGAKSGNTFNAQAAEED